MRIAVDATKLGSGLGGDETLLRGLLAGLAELVPDEHSMHFLTLLRPDVELPDELAGRRAFEIRRLGGPGALLQSLVIPATLWRDPQRTDLLCSLVHAPLVCPAPRALILTDISFRRHPEYFPLSARLRLNLLVPIHLRQARVVLTLSEFCRQDIVDAYHVPPERVFVMPVALTGPLTSTVAGADADNGQAWIAARGLIGPFFLYLGNLHPRKNVAGLIRAFTRARATAPELAAHQLAIPGGHWWGGGAEEQAAAEAPPGSVVLLGRVSDAQRDALLRSAQALAYLSLFEGFGLPPLEAMAVGTPVLASNVTAMPEVLGDAALLVDPLDLEAIVAGLVRLATEPALRADLSARGRKRAARYTPRGTAEAALAAFTAALS